MVHIILHIQGTWYVEYFIILYYSQKILLYVNIISKYFVIFYNALYMSMCKDKKFVHVQDLSL